MMDSMNKLNLNMLLNNMTSASQALSQAPGQLQPQPHHQSHSHSQAQLSSAGVKLSGLNSIGLDSQQQIFRALGLTNNGAGSAQQQQNAILASQLISNVSAPGAPGGGRQQDTAAANAAVNASAIVNSQPFFNLAAAGGLGQPQQFQQQQQQQGLKRPHETDGLGEKNSSRRRTVHQLEVLESVFKLCPNPTEIRRKQLGQMLKMEERQVVIWFQNKRQRVRAKMKEQENNTLRQQHSALKSELQREKARERALEQENSLLKTWMEDKVKKMEELRQASSELLVEYYKKKGNNSSNWKNALPSGLMEALKLPQKEGETSQGKEAAAEAEAPQVSGGGGEKTSPDTPLEAEEAGKGQEVVPKEEGAAAVASKEAESEADREKPKPMES